MHLYWLVIGILCTWRISHLLRAEDGPWQIVARLRRRAGTGFWGSLMDCFHCLSLWVAVPFAVLIGEELRHWVLLSLALSGGAILVERITAREGESHASYFEHPGGDDAVLRQREDTSAESGDRNDAGR